MTRNIEVLLLLASYVAAVQAWSNALLVPSGASRIHQQTRPSEILIGRRGSCSNILMMAREEQMTRRNAGTLAGWMLLLNMVNVPPSGAAQQQTKPPFFKADFDNGFSEYVNSTAQESLFFKDVKKGVGVPPKEGDVLRFQLAAYLPDGTVVSRFEGVERKITLGNGDVPVGLEEGLRGMQVGGERVLVFGPDIGFNSGWRRQSLEYIKGCVDETTCRLNTDRLIVRVVLVGYNKAQCLDGDMPVSLDASSLMSEGKVQISIGSDVCPEGNTEVTADRVKTLDLINKLKATGQLKAEEKQQFKIP